MSIFSSAASWAVRKFCEELEVPEVLTEIIVIGTEILLDDDD